MTSETTEAGIIEIDLSPEAIEEVLAQWEAENPGKRAHVHMGSDEFARRMMARIRATARIIPDA